MYVTKVIIIPCSLILLLSSLTLCATIVIYFKRVIKLYLGLVFYSLSEILLFIQVGIFTNLKCD